MRPLPKKVLTSCLEAAGEATRLGVLNESSLFLSNALSGNAWWFGG